MERDIRIVGIKRKQIDDEKLALAFLLLAKTLQEQRKASEADQAADDQHAEAA